MRSQEEILDIVRAAMVTLFALDPARVVPAARFYEDLAIDSIDTVDLVDQLARTFERRVDQRDFRNVRTVGDLIDTIHKLQAP